MTDNDLPARADDASVWLVEDASGTPGYHSVSDGTFHVLAPTSIAQHVSDLLNADAQAAPEREFLAASIAVWREIDRLSAEPGGYQGLGASTELRRRERAAWATYRDWLASVSLLNTRKDCDICLGKGYILSNGLIAKRHSCPACATNVVDELKEVAGPDAEVTEFDPHTDMFSEFYEGPKT